MFKEKNRLFRIVLAVFYIFIFILVFLLFFRAFSSVQLDDVNPMMNCSEKQLRVADVFYVIPYYDGVPISDNMSWCQEILSMNKSIRLHGYTHEYQEFGIARDKEYVENSMQVFEDCFGFSPEYFRAPNLKITEDNKKVLLSSLGMKLDGYWGYLFHKVYHCDEARSSKRLMYRLLLSDKFMNYV